MTKPKFKITVKIVTNKTYTISADNWRSAVEKIGSRLDAAGVDTLASFAVADEQGNAIDTFAGEPDHG